MPACAIRYMPPILAFRPVIQMSDECRLAVNDKDRDEAKKNLTTDISLNGLENDGCFVSLRFMD